MFEKLSDLFGRDLRYGATSDDPMITELLRQARDASEMNAEVEELLESQEELDPREPANQALTARITSLKKRRIEFLATLEELMENLKSLR